HVDGFPLWIQGNMVTRHAFALGILGNEVGEEAFVARMRLRRFGEVEASDRILEAPRGRLGSAHGTSVASLLQECEFELKSFQNVALILGHGMPQTRQSLTGNGCPAPCVDLRHPIYQKRPSL